MIPRSLGDLGPPEMSSTPAATIALIGLLQTQAGPPCPLVPLLLFPLPPLSLCECCLKEHDSIFNRDDLRGPSPEGSWQEMKAVHIVPDAFQPYTSVAGTENYPSPAKHLTLCVCLCMSCFVLPTY